MKNSQIENLYVDTIQAKDQGSYVNITTAGSNQINFSGSLNSSSISNMGTVNQGNMLIISGFFNTSGPTVVQSSGITVLQGVSTGLYNIECPSSLFASTPWGLITCYTQASGTYAFATCAVLSATGVYNLQVTTYSGTTGTSGSYPALDGKVNFYFQIIGQSA